MVTRAKTPEPTGHWARKTLTGKTLAEVYVEIDRNLGPKAYSKLPAPYSFLTDIKAPYVYELMTELFGIMGIGWGYETLSSRIDAERTYTPQGKSYERVEFYGRAEVQVWYALEDIEGRIYLPASVGGSTSDARHFAEQGAITNAVGSALGKTFGVQRHVYKNEEHPKEVVEAPAAPAKNKKQLDLEAADLKEFEGLKEKMAEVGTSAAVKAYMAAHDIKPSLSGFTGLSPKQRGVLWLVAEGAEVTEEAAS